MGWKANDLTFLAKAPGAVFAPSAYEFKAQGTKHVLFQSNGNGGGDNTIHELWWDAATGWHHTPLTQDAHASLAAGGPAGYVFVNEGTQHAIFTGVAADQETNGRVFEIWWQSEEKNFNDLTQNTGSPRSISDVFGVDFGDQNLFYQSSDSHIHALIRPNGGNWAHTDLTALTRAQLTIGNPTAYKTTTPFSKNVVYRGSDGNVHRLRQAPNAWVHENLTLPFPGATIDDQPFGFAVDAEGKQFIHYRGADGNLHQLMNDGSWHHTNMSVIVGAPLVTSGSRPTGYVFPLDGTLHVNYTGVDGHIHEVWRDTLVWHWNDLSAETGAPKAISSPSAFTFSNDNTQHVVYASDDHHLIELAWTQGRVRPPTRPPNL